MVNKGVGPDSISYLQQEAQRHATAEPPKLHPLPGKSYHISNQKEKPLLPGTQLVSKDQIHPRYADPMALDSDAFLAKSSRSRSID
jgi:hypothetical protein